MKLGAAKDTNIKPDISNAEADTKYPDSKLEYPVQNLINFIFDKKLMEASVTSVGYDPTKLPLGELSEDNVKLGYQHLRSLEEILRKIENGKTSMAASKPQLTSLSSAFYT
jgi:poly [ADP-ribose] polymerase